jgi:prepilin-type processing-associated H-X9-DG protein
VALVADKGPYGSALESKARNPGVPRLRIGASPDDWVPWNSPNHGGEGQVALFADGHAEFLGKPISGVGGDNIYTRWSAADGGGAVSSLPRVQGTPPTGIETPWSDTDSLIYP